MARASLYALTVFSLGRVHELFGFLTPLRIVLVVGAATVILTLFAPRGERQPVLAQREVRIVLALAALALLLLPFSVWPGGSWSFLQDDHSKVVVLFMLIVALATDLRVIRNLVWSLLTGIGLLGTFALAGAPVKTGGEYVMGRASASSTYDANDLAMMMVCTLPLAVIGVVTLRGVRRVVAAAVAVICVLTTIMTVSRGGFVGLAVVSILLLSRFGSAGARLAGLAGIVALVVVVAPVKYWDVMETIWNPTGASYVERGGFTRLELWTRGVGLFLRNPVTGVGIGMYSVADGLVYGRRGGWVTAHNSFIQVATELGLLGLALFVGLLAVSVQNARQTIRAAREEPRLQEMGWIAAGVEISLYAYMVVGFALSQAYSPMLYFLVAVATALRLEMERRRGAPA